MPASDPLACARRRLIVRRLPLFAAAWLGTMVVWAAVLGIEGRARIPVVALLPLSQAVIVGIAIAFVRRRPTSPLVTPATTATLILLGVNAIMFFAAVHGGGDLVAFVELTLYLASAVFFATGWAPAATLLVATVVPWLVVLAELQFYLPTVELIGAIAVGATVSVAMAEVYARAFAVAFERGERERMAGRALAASRDAYRDLAENASDLIYTHDRDGRFTYVNGAFARFAGAAAEEIVGRDCREFIAPHPDAPDVGDVIVRVAAGETIPPVLIPVNSADGDVQWLECVVSAITDAAGAVVGLRGIARDVTARRRAEEQLRTSIAELRHSEEMLRLLARRQVTIREEERKRIGFDLHDDVCQELVGLGILIEAVRRRLEAVAPDESRSLGETMRYMHEVVEHLRGLAHDLRPLLLRDLGLEGSLRSLADGMSTPETRVVAELPPSIPRLDETVEIDVYRIAQEALANAARHAHARTIHVRLALTDSRLELEVRDDGCGFVPNERRNPRLGLVAMQERALALGGHVAVTSAPALGTIVYLDCPITPPLALAAST